VHNRQSGFSFKSVPLGEFAEEYAAGYAEQRVQKGGTNRRMKKSPLCFLALQYAIKRFSGQSRSID